MAGKGPKPIPPTPLTSNMKEKYLQLQAAALARSLKGVDFEFNPKSKEDLVKLQVDLMHLCLQKELIPDQLVPLNQGVRNLIQLIVPELTQPVSPAVDPVKVVVALMEGLPFEEREKAITILRRQVVQEAAPRTS